MKNPRAMLMIIVSIGIAVGAVLLASRWMLEKSRVATSAVVVARNDINLGTQLTPEMLKVADWPRGSVPEGASDKVESLKDRVVKVSLLAGEPVLQSKLAPLGTKGGLSAVIGEGKRAMTVRVNDVIGVAGFALPGTYVDIVVNTEEDNSAKNENRSKSISKIVLERILVLAVAQESARDETKPKVVNAVTLEVTPEQAEKLDLARSVGTLSLVLRNQLDTSPASTTGVTKMQMLNRPDTLAPGMAPTPAAVLQPAPQPAAKAPVKRKAAAAKSAAKTAEAGEKVEIIRGVEKTVTEFQSE